VSKVLIIGIDGLDPFIIDKWKNELPNIGKLYNEKSEIIVESTFPPDSICAWTSIYTGENPAEHGLIESIDYLSARKYDSGNDRAYNFQGETFWDIAGDRGKKVCVINPFVAYPAWRVNGIMVSGPVFEGGETSAYPDNVLSEYSFPRLGGMVDFPDEKNLDTFLITSKKLTEDLADVGLKIYKEQNPDLYFITFLTLDRIKHFLWRFTDKEDIFYPGANNFNESIKSFYLLFDEIVGRFRND
jgi:predicted AlkP superfamily phosphohydrolase/phosphomutase